MDKPKILPNWKELLKKAWVNRVLYLMFAVQIFDIVMKVIESQPVTMKDAVLTVLIPTGVWLRLLQQVALATSLIHFPPPDAKGDPNA